MLDFDFRNATRVVLGRGTIARLCELVPENARVLVTMGAGSVERNGVLAQVRAALAGRTVIEFRGIEANPEYETLLRATRLVRDEQLDFLLAVGGGSVLDGTKFIAAAARFPGDDPWQIVRRRGAGVKDAVPMAVVLTLPATGSEANSTAVISRRDTGEKAAFAADACYHLFSILDPETTFTLPRAQLVNGIVDAYVHVMEQYATFPAAAPLQDRQAEAILATLVETAPAIVADPPSYDARATLMWCATNALDGKIGQGVPQDWATHLIGHELTALHGLDHAVTLAIVLPGLLRHQLERKREKLETYGRRVLGVEGADAAIARTETFFRGLGMRTRLSEHGLDAQATAEAIRARFSARGTRLGEHGDVDAEAAARIIRSRA
jgi:NADP-dependent alcohol dehydrogenase